MGIQWEAAWKRGAVVLALFRRCGVRSAQCRVEIAC